MTSSACCLSHNLLECALYLIVVILTTVSIHLIVNTFSVTGNVIVGKYE